MVKSYQPGGFSSGLLLYRDGPEVPFFFWGGSDLSMGLNEHVHCISGLASSLASCNG